MSLSDAWNELLRSIPANWVIGRPEYLPDLHQWRLFSFAIHGSDKPTDMRMVYADTEPAVLLGLADALRTTISH
jgi:hypothetical protein